MAISLKNHSSTNTCKALQRRSAYREQIRSSMDVCYCDCIADMSAIALRAYGCGLYQLQTYKSSKLSKDAIFLAFTADLLVKPFKHFVFQFPVLNFRER